VRVKDAIDCIEGWFDCRLGFPGSMIAIGSNRLYRTLAMRTDFEGERPAEDVVENALAASIISAFDAIKKSMGYSLKPVLHWRYQDKILMEHSDDKMRSMLITRVHIEGCQVYGPYEATERPSPIYLRVIVSNPPKDVLQVEFKPREIP
jgi:hypothetical protein